MFITKISKFNTDIEKYCTNLFVTTYPYKSSK